MCDLAGEMRGEAAKGNLPPQKTVCGRWRRFMRRSIPRKERRMGGCPSADVPLRVLGGAQRAPLDNLTGKKPTLGLALGSYRASPRSSSTETVDDLSNRLADGGQVDVLPARHIHII